jgi:hypothetical protein
MNGLIGLLQKYLGLQPARARFILHSVGVSIATASFVLISTALVAYDVIFLSVTSLETVQPGDIVSDDIRAPTSVPVYVSQVLTEQRKNAILSSIADIYAQPDRSVGRHQVDLATQIINFINHVRHDPYSAPQQRLDDLQKIESLTLDPTTLNQILTMNETDWEGVSSQVTSVLEQVMRGEIRESTIASVIRRLPVQVSIRFPEDQAAIIVSIVEDLIQPNALLDVAATNAAREAAIANVAVSRSIERGEVIIHAGERIDEAAYEALEVLGLLQPSNRRYEEIARAALVSIVVVVITGLYIARFKPILLRSSRFLTLLAIFFLLVLVGARVSSQYGQIYLYPTASLALIYVALVGPEVAIIGMLGQAVLIGLMGNNNQLELPMLVGVGGMMAALTLRRPERLNGYFMPGLLVGIANIAVTVIFYPNNYSLTGSIGILELSLYSFLNGILAAGLALAGIYAVTLFFNLPTGLKLIELSQPNQPLLQRLLREAPGTYQHSLMVANLAEQAANAIGVNADLVRVAALYHDVGKMTNPAFFTENQVEGVNPHNVLDDPARSAAIIISHVTEGDKIARQYRLPSRIRDFILEHHGTQVLYFYDEAVKQAGDDEAIDIEQFTYPGPKPQTRETAVVMLADSCEATIRSRKPTKKQEIADVVQEIIDHKIQTNQLDESGLTFNDVKAIRTIFVDMLQAVFHPRINYPAPSKPVKERLPAEETPRTEALNGAVPAARPAEPARQIAARPQFSAQETPVLKTFSEDADEKPLPEVPPLPRTSEQKAVKPSSDQDAPRNDPSD